MASNYTENFGLCQWETTDQVLRTEFNEDSTKIDAALKALTDRVAKKATLSDLNALTQTVSNKADQIQVDTLSAKAGNQLIKRTTLSQAEEHCYINLLDIDWAQWATVTIRLRPVLMEGDSFRIQCSMENFNQQLTGNPATQFTMHLFPYFDADALVSGLRFPGNSEGNGLLLTYTYTQLKQLELYSTDYNFQPGSVFEIWGTK